MKEKIWNFLYRRWKGSIIDAEPGYSLLFTVPPDLPVFLKIACEICARQDLTHHVETLVIPDHVHVPFRSVVDRLAKEWPEGKMRLVEMRPVDRVMRQLANWPVFTSFAATIHWLQLTCGLDASKSTHALLHDADLFLIDDGFMRRHFEHCREHDYGCVGLDRPWNGFSWFDKPGFEHVLASWEMIFDRRWLHTLEPWRVRPQRAVIHNENGWFGTALYAQAYTGPKKVGRLEKDFQHVHFGYVISGYRRFQRAKEPFLDDNFSLLLIRLLVDAFDPENDPADLPSAADLAKGITDGTQPAIYNDETATEKYPEFRNKLEELLQSGVVSPERVSVMRERIAAFDRAYRWHADSVAV